MLTITRAPLSGAVQVLMYAVVAVALAALVVPVAEAQVATGKGRVSGVIMDTDGNPIPGARIVLTYTATGQQWEVSAGDDGRWLKGNMGRGNWNIDFLADGYLPDGISIRVQEINRSKPIQTYLVPGEAAAAASGPIGAFSDSLGNEIKKGNELAAAGDHAAALAHFEKTLVDFPLENNQYVYLVHINAGNSAFELGNKASAEGHFAAVLEHDSGNVDARQALANLALSDRDIEKAMGYLNEINLDEIRNPVTHYNIGNLLFEQGQSPEAEGFYQRAVQLNPDFVEAHLQLALCLIQQEKMAEAKPHLQKVIELDPDSSNGMTAQSLLDYVG